MLDRTPKVFISYSWTSKEYQKSVIDLASRMCHDGVDVKLDVWDLKEGQDKYAYMELCVADDSIDKVLILSDKMYATKADNRKGGVGNETTIISSEIYDDADQQKFIPVVMERDVEGRVYLPKYLKSRIYRDLSGDKYEEEYRTLIRNIFELPTHIKPQVGKHPLWLQEELPDTMYTLERISQKIISAENAKVKKMFIRQFLNEYIDALKPFYKNRYNDEEYIKAFSEMKIYRNVFLDYINNFSDMDDFGSIMADTFERVYNLLYNIETFKPSNISCSYEGFDLFLVHVWELFICVITYMLHFDMHKDINKFLNHTYFLRNSPFGSETGPCNYTYFRFYSEVIEERIKPRLSENLSRKFTLTGHYVISERAYMPIYTPQAIANADLFLNQVYKGLNIDTLTGYGCWFPTLYVYADQHNSMWRKLVSRKFCEKIMPIFGVETIAGLIKVLSKCTADNSCRYTGCCYRPTSILDWTDTKNIATLP